MYRILFVLALFTTFLSPNLAIAQTGYSGLPVPRYVNLKYNEANGRVGPSMDYPVRYIFARKNLPVRVIEETPNNLWRKIEDHNGNISWVNKSQLISSDYVLVQTSAILRKKPEYQASGRAEIESGVLVRLENCTAHWCKVKTGQYRGWLAKDNLWGVN
ncbi:MAG: SH3 domain-containing protein [bacterium]